MSINPQITTVEIGIKSLREVTIYPLSLADQAKLARTLSKVFQSVMVALSNLKEEPEGAVDSGEPAGTIEVITAQLSNVDIAEAIVDIIQENFESILKLIVDDNEKISMEEITNEQFYSLVELVYEVNYESTSKNFMALVKRAKGAVQEKKEEKKPKRKVSHSTKPSPRSADGMATG